MSTILEKLKRIQTYLKKDTNAPTYIIGAAEALVDELVLELDGLGVGHLQMTHFSAVAKDKTPLSAADSRDPTKFAAYYYGVPESEVTPEQRRAAQALTFGPRYGIGRGGLEAVLTRGMSDAPAYEATKIIHPVDKNKPHSCPHCDATYAIRASLASHRQNKHPETIKRRGKRKKTRSAPAMKTVGFRKEKYGRVGR